MKRRIIGRYFTKGEALFFEPEDFDEAGRFKGDPVKDGVMFREFAVFAKLLSAEAAKFLRACGLPDSPGVSYPLGHPKQWEACAEDPHAPGRSFAAIDEFLREHCGIEVDAPEELASQIVRLEHHFTGLRLRVKDYEERLLTAAMLMRAQTLFQIYAKEDSRRKKRRQPKRLAWADAMADKVVGKGTSDKERWLSITEDLEVFADGRRWLVSREEDEEGIERLWGYDADDERAALQRGPAYRAFIDGYVTPARKRR